MVERMLNALARRGAAGDLDALSGLARLESQAGAVLGDAVRGAHEPPAAYSWTELAIELGVTRQAARQRFGR